MYNFISNGLSVSLQEIWTDGQCDSLVIWGHSKVSTLPGLVIGPRFVPLLAVEDTLKKESFNSGHESESVTSQKQGEILNHCIK